MAQSVRRLRAAFATRVRSPVSARPTINAEKFALLCNPASGGTLQALQLHCSWLDKKLLVSKAEVFPHLRAWDRVGRGIPHEKDFVSLSALSYSKK
jgi:hypothetical protein